MYLCCQSCSSTSSWLTSWSSSMSETFSSSPYCFMPLSVTFALAEDHKVNRQQNLLGLFSAMLLKWLEWNFMCFLNNLNWTFWHYLKVRNVWPRKITAALLIVSQTSIIGMHRDIYGTIYLKLGMMTNISECYTSILVLVTLNKSQSHRGATKQQLLW